MQIQAAKGQTNLQLLIKGFKIPNILYTRIEKLAGKFSIKLGKNCSINISKNAHLIYLASRALLEVKIKQFLYQLTTAYLIKENIRFWILKL